MDLNALMAIDHVIRVHADGTVTEPRDIHAPEIYVDTDGDGSILPEHDREMVAMVKRQGWTLMDGYSAQQGYSGPIMHPSEFIGGGLETDILANPGHYVAVVVETTDGDDEPAGWVVARKDS